MKAGGPIGPAVNWDSLRTLAGPARFVPAALERMLFSETPDAATAAYWELDNRIVVQGRLFEAAESATEWVILRICSGDYSTCGLARALDLLVEIAWGEPDPSECAAGNWKLGERCRDYIARHLECIMALCESSNDRVLLGALDLVDRLASDRSSRMAFLSALGARECSEVVRRRLQELTSKDD